MSQPFCFRYRVGYCETDRMNVMHHMRYFEMFERARTELLRSLGSSYRELEERGIYLPVVEASAQYRAPVFYDEEVVVETLVIRLKPFEVAFGYTIKKAGGGVACEGETRHAIVGADFRLRRLKGEEWRMFRDLVLPYFVAQK